MTYKLVPANNEQKEIIFDIKKRSIMPYVEKMFGWDEVWQRNFVYATYKAENIEFIVVEDKYAGILEVENDGKGIFLKNILITEEYQGRGIGTDILKSLIIKANKEHRYIKLEVLAVNRRAEAFYKRLGFRVKSKNNIKVDMWFEK